MNRVNGVPFTWGEWRLVEDDSLLQHDTGYRVDFKQMGTAAGMLDIIFQVNRKKLSEAAVGQLIRALGDIYDPQASLCQDGREHPFNPEERFRQRLIAGFGLSRRAF